MLKECGRLEVSVVCTLLDESDKRVGSEVALFRTF